MTSLLPTPVSHLDFDFGSPGPYLILGRTGCGKVEGIRHQATRMYGKAADRRFHIFSLPEYRRQPAICSLIATKLEQMSVVGGGLVVCDEIEKLDDLIRPVELLRQLALVEAPKARLIFTTNYGSYEARRAEDAGASAASAVEILLAAVVRGLGEEFVDACHTILVASL